MKQINVWYDRLPEPKRFLLFFGLVAVPVGTGIVFYPPAGVVLGAAFAIARLWPWR